MQDWPLEVEGVEYHHAVPVPSHRPDPPVRKLRFLELFAGMGGLSRAVKDLVGDLVEVLEPQDLYHH